MIRRFLRCALILAVGVSLGWLGCGEDEGEGTPTGPDTDMEGVPEIPKLIALVGPKETEENKADSTAVAARQYAQGANEFFAMALGHLSQVEQATPERSGDSWVWNVESESGDLTIRVTATPTMDPLGVDWTVVLSGKMMGMMVTDWTAATGHTDVLGTSGEFTMYLPNMTTVMGEMSWNIEEDGTITANTKTTDPLTGVVVLYQIVNRPDGSGSLTMWHGDTQTFSGTWDSEGVVTPA